MNDVPDQSRPARHPRPNRSPARRFLPPGAPPLPVAGLLLVLPILLLHGRGLAEAAIGVLDGCFLARSAACGDWRWLRTGWVRIGLLWWGWLMVCSLPVAGLGQGGVPSLVQAMLVVRFLVFVAALEHWLLAALGPVRTAWPSSRLPFSPGDVSERDHGTWAKRDALRRAMAWLVGLAALYIALQCLLQFATGHDLWGWPRWGDGSLTGPYREPRAGPPMSRLLFPAVLPAASWLLGRGRRLAAVALFLGAVAVMVLIGQRMPLLLTGLGLATSALLLPRLRLAALVCALAACLLVPATAVISPPTFGHLVTRFGEQMRHFPQSAYGRIAVRALVIAEANPLTGRGFDGYRTGCALPAMAHGLDGQGDGGGTGPEVCVQHPHNHYLQALTDSGLPGLVLFCLLVLAWLHALARGLWRPTGGSVLGGAGLGRIHAGQPGRWAGGQAAQSDPGSSSLALSRPVVPGIAPAEPSPARLRSPGPGGVRHALRVGLFVAALVQEWPIASASSVSSMPLSGWFFLLLGFGLAEARAYMRTDTAGVPP